MIRRVSRCSVRNGVDDVDRLLRSKLTFPGKPWAGPNCIKYTIVTTVYAFNTSDVSSNADGRKTAVNDALLLAYPVQVSVAS